MSQIEEPIFEGSGYPVIAWANGQKLINYQQFGSYQGEWLMLAKGETDYFVYKDYYGSCSGCDSYEATFGYENKPTKTNALQFAKDYPSFIEIPVATIRNLVVAGTLRRVFPANVRHSYRDEDSLSYDDFVDDSQIAVKIEENIDVTAADILSCKNQEIKQEALRRFGYDNFVRDAGMEEIDRVGEDALLRAGDIVFAHVKDSSTPRRYLLRVPPQMKTLREATAWTFGMKPGEYAPLVET